MQSVNGDVQLSVTLDTKGIQSDAQKIKKEIEKELSSKSSKVSVSGALSEDTKKSVQEMGKYTDSIEAAKEAEADLQKAEEARIDAIIKRMREGKSTTEDKSEEIELTQEYSEVSQKAQEEEEARIDEIIRKMREKQNLQATSQTFETEEDVASSMQWDASSINWEKIKEEQAQVQEQIKEMASAQEESEETEQKIIADTQAYADAIKEAKIQAQQLGTDLRAFSEGQMYSEEFKAVKEDAEILSKKLGDVNKKLREMELLEQTDSDKYKQMAEQAEKIAANLKGATSEMSRMRNTGEAYTLGSNPQEMAQVQKQYDAVTNKMALMGKHLTDVNKLTSMLPGKLGASVRKITNATQGIQRLSQLSFKEVSENLSTLGSELSTFATGSLSTAGAVASSIGIIVGAIVIRVTQAIKQAKEGLAQLAKILKKGLQVSLQKLSGFAKILAGSFVKLGKTLSGTLIQGIRKLISKLMSLKGAIKENLDEMAKLHNGNNAVNKALSNLMSSLNYLKGALATAFVPILTTVEPMLTILIDKLAEATTMVGILIAKMTGATSFQKAVRKQKDYADSLKKVGGAASDASKQLADYDKLQVVQSNKSGGAGVDFEEISIEAVDISKIFDDLSDKASKLGTDLGTKLRDGLNSIPWDEIKEKANQLASAIASFINSFIEVPGLAQAIGRTVGEAINTIVGALNTFLTETHWEELGQFIGEGLMTAIETIHWDELGQLFYNSINSAFDLVKGFTEIFDGLTLGQKLSEMITTGLNGIDWETIKTAVNGLAEDFAGILNGLITPETLGSVGITLGETINTAVGGLLTFEETGQWDQWAESLKTGIQNLLSTIKFDDAGQAVSNLASGILTLIESAVDGLLSDDAEGKNIGDKLIEFIENVDWAGLAGKAVEISQKLAEGLDKVFAELQNSGEYDKIIDAIVDFLNEKENWERLFKRFKNSIIRDVVIEQVWGQTKELFNLSKGQFEDIVDAWKEHDWARIGFDILTGIASAWLGALDILVEPLNGLAVKLYQAIRDALGISGSADGTSTESEEIGRQIIGGFFTGRGLYAFGEKIGKWFTEEVAPWFTVEKWSGIIENVQTALATKWTEIKGFLSMIKATLMNRLAIFKSGVLNIFVGLAGAIKTPLNTMIAAIESFVNYLIKGINSAIDTLNSLEFDVPDWVPEIGGKSMGLNIPSVSKITLPRLAQGAVIPPNKEFMAVLGDQKSGTNIETPLKTMMDAFRQVLSETGGVGGNNNQPIVLQLNGRVLAQAVWDEERKKYRQTSSYSY